MSTRRDDGQRGMQPHTCGTVSPCRGAAPWLRAAKYWPSVGRLNNVLGDRKLFCTCPDVSEYA